jgi:hypothetical protein
MPTGAQKSGWKVHSQGLGVSLQGVGGQRQP